MSAVTIIYNSTTGNTEYVVDRISSLLRGKHKIIVIDSLRAESSRSEDLQNATLLILASGTWNISGNEGQLNQSMHKLLFDRCADIDLKGKPCAVIALGDTRYRYTARAAHILSGFLTDHGASKVLSPLVVVDEPDEQHDRIDRWTDKLFDVIAKLGDK